MAVKIDKNVSKKEFNLGLFWYPKSNKILYKSIPRGIKFLIDFGIDFLSILARFWKPTWSHVGYIFAQNGGPLWHAPLFLVGSMLFFDLGGPPGPLLVPTCLHFSSQNPPNPPKTIPRCIIFSINFCIDFASILEATLEPFWPLFRSKYGYPH